MKRLLIYLTLVFSVAVFAQQQSATDEEPGDESEQLSAINDGGAKRVVEADPDPVPPLSDPLDEEENTEVSDDAEKEFKPDEEISEDYPVPLPSDI